MDDLTALRSLLLYAHRQAADLDLQSTAYLLELAIADLSPQKKELLLSDVEDTAFQGEIRRSSCSERLH